MPMYEYYCHACDERFEELRPFNAADDPAICPACHQPRAQRVIALVASFARSDTGSSTFDTSVAQGGGGACSSGSCCGGSCSF